jgi:hypothetical protein
MIRTFRIPEKGHTPQGSLTVAYEYVPELENMLIGIAFCSPRERGMERKKGKEIATQRLHRFKMREIGRLNAKSPTKDERLVGVARVPWEVSEDGRRAEPTWAEFRNNVSFVVATLVKGPRWYKEKFLPWWAEATERGEVQ